MILCDPVGRLEKLFHSHFQCGQGCFQSASALQTERQGSLKQLWEKEMVAEHMWRLMQLFLGRLFVLHQEQLRADATATYHTLAQVLGAREAYGAQSFQRYNAAPRMPFRKEVKSENAGQTESRGLSEA